MVSSVRSVFFGVAAALLTCGCTVLTSELPSDLLENERAPAGVDYMLPKGLVTATLSVNETTGEFDFGISEVEWVPDTQLRYFLRYRPHPSYDDEVTVTMVESGKPFIKQIDSDTTDRTKDIIVNLVKAAAFAGAFEVGANDKLLADIIIDLSDPSDVHTARSTFEAEMRRYLRLRHEKCDDSPPEDDAGKAVCRKFERLLALSDPGSKQRDGDALITLNVSRAPQSPSPGVPADCTVGICYRPKEPYIVSYGVTGVVRTAIYELPNAATVYSIDIKRAFLVQKIQGLKFDDNGFLTEVSIDKDSELLAAARLPLEVMTAVSQGLQLRIDYTQENTNVANSQAELIKQQAAFAKKQKEAEASYQAAAGSRGTSNAARSFVLSSTANAPPSEPAPSGGSSSGTGTGSNSGTGSGPAVDPDFKP